MAVFEGEKCVDAFVQAWPKSAGLVTTWAGGTGSWRKTDWSPLSGRAVNLIADADTTGREAMKAIAAHLHGLDCTVRRFALPEGETGDDIADGIEQDAGAALQFLKDRLEDYDPQKHAPPPAPETDKRKEQAAADIEAGRIPGNSAFQLGRDLGRDLAGRFLFVKNETGGNWFEGGETHWNRCVINDVRSVSQDTLLLSHLDAARAEMDGKRAAWLINGAWRHPSLDDALRGVLAGKLPPAPLTSIATPDGVYTPTAKGVGEPVKFDPALHGHLGVTASRLPDKKTDTKSVLLFPKMVYEWCGEDVELADWLQRLAGAGMIGKAHRKVVNIIGPAGCGKTTCTKLLSTALGPLAMVANERLFDARGNHNEQVVDLIQLQPRLTFLQESQGKRIDADLLNKLSGGERLKERRPHGHDVEGAVTTLVCILGEAPFALSGTTGGTLERLQVCPFKKPATIDPELIDRAQDPASPEATSALLWLFEGAQEFLKTGFGETPQAALKATRTAHHGYDEIAAWLYDHTEPGTGGELLGRMQKAGVETGKATAGSIGKRARKLGWTDDDTERSGAQRQRLIPPTRARRVE